MRLCWPVRDFSDRTTIEAPYFKRKTLCRILTPKEETSNRVKCIPMTETLGYHELSIRYTRRHIHDTVNVTCISYHCLISNELCFVVSYRLITHTSELFVPLLYT